MTRDANRLVIFMYHALYGSESERQAIEPADRPYAVSVKTFERQLDILDSLGIPVLDPHLLPGPVDGTGGVLLTFDDGHHSNYAYATSSLVRRGLRGAFFVTTDFINGRVGYCRWNEIRDMAASGMLIGSHGRTHRFFDSMSYADALAEFESSKTIIEQETSREVAQISFPGGRFKFGQLEAAKGVGYQLFHTSRLGFHKPGTVGLGDVLSRIPVRHATDDDEFAAWARGDWRRLFSAQVLAAAKISLRRAIGNSLYHRLYEELSGHN